MRHLTLTGRKLNNCFKPYLKSFFLLTGLLLSGCASQQFSYPVATSAVDADQLLLESGVFQIEGQSYRADYGTLVVRENRSDTNTRLIELPLIRIYSRSASPAEPVFMLHGGPGASNIREWVPDYLLANHDIIMLGYRGADGSSVLKCGEVESALESDEDALSKIFLQAMGRAWESCARRLISEGVDLDGYSIEDVIEDMEAARKALKYPRINLLSQSYGTRLAYLYAVKYPDKIHRLSMIGALPPGHFNWEPEMVDKQLKYYAGLWSKDPDNLERSPDLLATIKKVAHNMPQSWMNFDINPGKVRLVTFLSLYDREGAAKVFDAYIAAEKGDYSGLALMSKAFDYVVPPLIVWGDFISKAASVDRNLTRDYFTEMDPKGAIIGSPMGKLAWGSLQFGHWPVKPIAQKYRKLQPTNVETLIISGSIDFSTPAEFAENELMPCLSRGQHVVLSEAGHVKDLLYGQSKNSERLLVSFYQTGVADKSLNVEVPMDFKVGWGWPGIAKTAVGGGVGLLALLLFL